MFGTCLLCLAAVLSLSETKNMQMEDTLVKASSKLSLMSSLSASLETNEFPRRSSSQSRLIIDIDTDLIHHRSYSEFDDEDDDDDPDETGLIKEQDKLKEYSALLHQQHKMYDPALSSSQQVAQESNNPRNTVYSKETYSDNIQKLGTGRISNGSVVNNGFIPDAVTDTQHRKMSQQQGVLLASANNVDECGVTETQAHRTNTAATINSDTGIRDGRATSNNEKFVQEY